MSVPPEHEELRMCGERCVALTNLFVHPLRRGRGWADALVRKATKYADKHGLTLVLWALPYGAVRGAGQQALMNFYAQHDFVHLYGMYMVRYAQT